MCVLIDSSRAFNPALLRARLGHVPPVVARYLGTGGGAATALCPTEVANIHDSGCKLLPIFNDLDPARLQTAADADAAWSRCETQATRLAVPQGVYLAFDLESGWVPSDAWWAQFLAHVYASQWGGVGIWYVAGSSPALITPPQVPYADRMLYWRASWVPEWEQGLVWRPYCLQEVAWQWMSLEDFDLSWIKLPLPSIGQVPEGLW